MAKVNAHQQEINFLDHGWKERGVIYGPALAATHILYAMKDVTMLIVSSVSWSSAGSAGESINRGISTEQIYSAALEGRMLCFNPHFFHPAVLLFENHAAGLFFPAVCAIGSVQTDSHVWDSSVASLAFAEEEIQP